jgi:hypothetical protein
MHKCCVVAFGFVAAFSCIVLIIGAKSDAKRYAVILEALGKSNEIQSQRLDDLEEFLSGTGPPRSEAQEVISADLRAPFLKPSATIELVPLVRDISAVAGTNIVWENQKFLNAFGRGAEAVITYCTALNALSATEITSIRYMDQHAQSRKALEKALERLEQRFGGSYERLRNANAR